MTNRIVVKVGTSTLCHTGGGPNFRSIDLLARALADLKNSAYEVALVTSGAIGTGVSKLRLGARPTDMREKQAVAAVGQLELMHIYDKVFGEYGATVGQILLTREDIDDPAASANLLGTFGALFRFGVIPIVNENDSVAFVEIASQPRVFGENDILSAAVARLIGARLLVILTDFDGLYDADPRANPGARLIPEVTEITPEIERLAGGAGSSLGTGGMATKIQAVKLATSSGCDVVITSGADLQNIGRAVRGEGAGTLFRAAR
ncbi:MAG: glutamate 5-kinase [Oscillospiraceae bacterium]|jgi:glutamate 5-kinase|nr:glutamate 5-kinase [Oscillospiraceae bacterium]